VVLPKHAVEVDTAGEGAGLGFLVGLGLGGFGQLHAVGFEINGLLGHEKLHAVAHIFPSLPRLDLHLVLPVSKLILHCE